jgi:hypothetical protein
MDEELEKLRKKWEDLTPDERFERMAWSVATLTAFETCESPHEIYRRMMAWHQEQTKPKD